MIYHDRMDAGKRLAERLMQYSEVPNKVVLGLPRGGVIVAREVARRLAAPLDVLIVRKIGYPGDPDFAVGAISETGVVLYNEQIATSYGVNREYLEREKVRQQEEIERRLNLYRGGRGLPQLAGKTVIMVDDGVTTGISLKTAVTALRKVMIKRLVIALPVASQEVEQLVAGSVDEWICLQTPEHLTSAAPFYEEFPKVEDEDVVEALK
ncbi:phosphoribosyltransferase [Geomesophilobacter sediminis]|uniref:Phosphoribosyltransferase n=1 Tax=Geomesophilobacter sediminis TaxID=2798584 RepID=A0A8J7JDP2_9BACT|nr:phosphoribosyltransferase family protein [Geomesophilobacter sediminis]MBJ6723789.1 phosphoribosyltransferase [Geomesophilobacter sediminis]